MPGASGWLEGALGAAKRHLDERLRGDASCRRCRTPIKPGRQFCSACKSFSESALASFRAQATELLWTVGPLHPQWSSLLESFTAQTGIHAAFALEEIRLPAGEWVRRFASFILSDGVVTDDELRDFNVAVQRLGCPADVVAPLAANLERVRWLGRVRAGQLPNVQVRDLHLPPDEKCHADTGAVLVRSLARGPSRSDGRLLLTNRKLRFVADRNGAEVPWSKVLRIYRLGLSAFGIDASGRGLPGAIEVADAEWIVTVAETLIRMDRRVVLPEVPARDTRRIPQAVKLAVWQRDSGRCTQCGSNSYLEFDHVIPLSLGGATSEANLQLLCRGCNLAKSDRI